MNTQTKKPVLLRLIFCIVTLAVFAYVMFPIQERDFMEVFYSHLDPAKTDSKIESVITMTKAVIKNQENAQVTTDTASVLLVTDNAITASVALLNASEKYGVNLADYIHPIPEVRTTKDVISIVKRDCAPAVRRGIDLSGGGEFLVTLNDIEGDTTIVTMNFDEKADRGRELIRSRLEKIGVYESEISVQGGKYLSIRVPVTTKEEKNSIRQLITQSAKLKFHIVADNSAEEVAKKAADPANYRAPDGYEIKQCTSIEDGKIQTVEYLIRAKEEMTGNNIKSAHVNRDEHGQIIIAFSFNSVGAKEFGEVTARNMHKQLAIVLDGTLYSAPTILSMISSNGQITGNFSREEAETVANALSSGNLPFVMEIKGEFDVDPTLGTENVRAGMFAAIGALIGVVIFMAIFYLKSGWIANLALVANVILVFGALAAFQQTLTLPGIAGVILTIGMAVDANVLINERIREELREGRSIFNAVENGYARAFWTIFDSNITTLLVGIILIFIATGAVKGFAIVLSIGIVTSMFTSLMLTHVAFDVLAHFDMPKSLPMLSLGGIGVNPKYCWDFLKIRNISFLISSALILLSIVMFVVRGADAFSIDFRGGTQMSYSYDTSKDRIPDQEFINLLSENGFKGIKATYKKAIDRNFLEIVVGPDQSQIKEKVKEAALRFDGDMKLVDAETTVSPLIVELITKKYPGYLLKDQAGRHAGEVTADDTTVISGLVGESFATTALWALFFAGIGILIYITLRFEMVYAVCASIALLHDIIVSTGIFLLLGGEISLTVVAAILTIYGFSLNDTIVIFDRIREQFHINPKTPFRNIINDSINQCMSRTIMTTLTVLISVLILLVFGGVAIHDFAEVMLIGLLAGTYSSVFLASPLAYVWYKKFGIKHDEASTDELAPNPKALRMPKL